jgi:predicted small lipoprotein YifL
MKATLPILLAASALAACGQTGALYLPDEGVTTPVEIRPAPAAEPPAAAAPEEDEDRGEEVPGTPPPGTGD